MKNQNLEEKLKEAKIIIGKILLPRYQAMDSFFGVRKCYYSSLEINGSLAEDPLKGSILELIYTASRYRCIMDEKNIYFPQLSNGDPNPKKFQHKKVYSLPKRTFESFRYIISPKPVGSLTKEEKILYRHKEKMMSALGMNWRQLWTYLKGINKSMLASKKLSDSKTAEAVKRIAIINRIIEYERMKTGK